MRVGAARLHHLQRHRRDDGREHLDRLERRGVLLLRVRGDEGLHQRRLRLCGLRSDVAARGQHRREHRGERGDHGRVLRNGRLLLRLLCGEFLKLRREPLFHHLELQLVLAVFRLGFALLDAREDLLDLLGVRLALGFELRHHGLALRLGFGQFRLQIRDLLQRDLIARERRAGRKLHVVRRRQAAQVGVLVERVQARSPARRARHGRRRRVHRRSPDGARERLRLAGGLLTDEYTGERRKLRKAVEHGASMLRGQTYGCGLRHGPGSSLRVDGTGRTFDVDLERGDHLIQRVHEAHALDAVLPTACHARKLAFEVYEFRRGDAPLRDERLKLAAVVAALDADLHLVDPALDRFLDLLNRNVCHRGHPARAVRFSHACSPSLPRHDLPPHRRPAAAPSPLQQPTRGSAPAR